MNKRYHLIKEITCPECEGQGFRIGEGEVSPAYDLDFIKEQIVLANTEEELEYWKQEEHIFNEYCICECCQGKGYVVDAVDLQTGFRIIEGGF